MVDHSHNGTASPWNFGPESLSISKSSVLFVRELRIPQKGSSNRFGNFSRAAVKLRVKEFDIEGFVHVPPGGAAMKRLDHSDHPFVSLTTVLLTGPEGETMVPFLAVNLEHIGAVQEAAVSASSDGVPAASRAV